jgi:hypothetical protein
MEEGSTADEQEWLHGERAFRGQPWASRRGRDRSAIRDAGYDAEYGAAGGAFSRSGQDFGRGYLRGRGTEYDAESGHPELGRGRRSDYFRLHGRGDVEAPRTSGRERPGR